MEISANADPGKLLETANLFHHKFRFVCINSIATSLLQKKKHKTRVRVLTCIIRNIVRSKIVVVNKHSIAQLDKKIHI